MRPAENPSTGFLFSSEIKTVLISINVEFFMILCKINIK